MYFFGCVCERERVRVWESACVRERVGVWERVGERYEVFVIFFYSYTCPIIQYI